MYFLIIIFLSLQSVINGAAVTDVTSDLFSEQSSDLVGAFGDFNADKLTDLFVLSEYGTQVDVLLARKNNEKYNRQKVVLLNDSSYITGVVPGDFDGDLQMDILVTSAKSDSDATYKTDVYWSGETNGKPTTIDTLQDSPFIVDWNADMVPDILGETKDGVFVWLGLPGERSFNKTKISKDSTLQKPHSNAFLDLNNDYIPDVFFTNKDNYEEWYNVDGHFTQNNTIPLPNYKKNNADTKYEYIGQASFADFDQDSEMDLIVPVCKDTDCTQSEIVMYYKEKWLSISESFVNDSDTWSFVKTEENTNLKNKQMLPTTLRMGDFNMDGYPDALAVLKMSSDRQAAFLLMNEECQESDSFCHTFGRKLVVQWKSLFSKVNGALLATFYDIYEDGILDILLVATDETNKDTPVLKAYKNIFTADACFVKITVVGGLCNKVCPHNRQPFGSSNQPGPSIKYETLSPGGKPQKSSATQLSQAAHYALQLPFVIFGLGQTPNFVEKLGVGIPQNTSDKLHREWTQIIPNSQLLVIPYPHEEPSSWALHLYITPSHLMYITGAVLLGTLGFVAGIVGILHLRERKQDKREKQQESQKFHFDAM